jgi:hypothetical protein
MTGLWRVHAADKVRGRGKVGGAGWGTVLVRALIVGTPLVRGALAWQQPTGGRGVVRRVVAEVQGCTGDGSVVQKVKLR